MLTEPRVTPSVLRLVTKSIKEKGLNANSGLTVIADRVRNLNPSLEGTDRKVILDYFQSLGVLETTKRQENQAREDKRKLKKSHLVKIYITERTDFSLPEGRPSDIMPWEA